MGYFEMVTRDLIFRFEDELKKLPQVLLKIKHEFAEGLYARTMTIPAGVALVGAIHASESFMIVRKGSMAIWTEDGIKNFEAGDLIKSFPGAKRVGYAHEDTILTAFHANPTNETDPELLWEMYIVESFDALEFDVTLSLAG